MRGMILAAGRGARMGSLTDEIPKPLLRVGAHFLIEYSLFSFVKIGVKDIVINVAYRGDQIKQALGNGEKYGVRIQYSDEMEALETGGGIVKALPLLGAEPFIVLSSDIITDFPLEKLPQNPEGLAHLVVVDNPSYHPKGDFNLSGNKIACQSPTPFTFANIGVYRPELFDGCQVEKFRLGNLLFDAAAKDAVTGERYAGVWHNVGTPADIKVYCGVD